MAASLPRKYRRTCCQYDGFCTSWYVLLNSGRIRFEGSCLGFATVLAVGFAVGAAWERVGDGAGEFFAGVTALLELGVPFGVESSLDLPRKVRNDFFETDTSPV